MIRKLNICLLILAVALLFSGCKNDNSGNEINSLDDDGEAVVMATEACENLLNGAIEPCKDLQIFTDENYTEVTTTSRDYWDEELLPDRVKELEREEYNCFPLPLEFSNQDDQKGMEIISEVTKVEWTCELYWDDYRYLEPGVAEIDELENQGYTCTTQSCFVDDEDGEVVLCAK